MQVSKDEMTVVWAPPENDGGKSITGYILERKEKRAVRWVPCTKSPISERRMKVTNLIPNHEYQFRVKAENEVGLGEPSKPCRPVAAKDPIGELMIGEKQEADLSLIVLWDFYSFLCHCVYLQSRPAPLHSSKWLTALRPQSPCPGLSQCMMAVPP